MSHSARIALSDLLIQTKDNRLVPLAPNPVQADYLDRICPGWRDGEIAPRGLREIILKARQFGFSTLIEALFFLVTINTPNTTTVVVAHDNETSEELFQMVHRFWANLPPSKRPHAKYNSRRQLYWPRLNSRFLVRTAGARGVGRGLTIHNLHTSEAAFYPHPKLLTGLLQAVPAQGNICIESTANGEAGDGAVFHDEYQAARKNRSPFTARFYAWWQHDEYETDPPQDFQRDPDEITLAVRHDLDRLYGPERTNRKLAWRRTKRGEPGMGNLLLQEYPSDEKEAFLVSGSRYFTEWDEARFCVYPGEVAIERYWTFFGGYDWGHFSPACFLLACADDRGRVIVIDEEYHSGLTDPEQAEKVTECLTRNNLKPADVTIWADPAMWVAKTDTIGKRVANVQAFHSAGLRFVKASNGRIPGWANVRRYLHDVDSDRTGATRFLRILRGRCPNLIRTFPLQNHDERNPEDLDTKGDDHSVDSLRYLLASRPRPSEPDPDMPVPADYTPLWLKNAQTARRRKL